jgi:hypothetical protein
MGGASSDGVHFSMDEVRGDVVNGFSVRQETVHGAPGPASRRAAWWSGVCVICGIQKSCWAHTCGSDGPRARRSLFLIS